MIHINDKSAYVKTIQNDVAFLLLTSKQRSYITKTGGTAWIFSFLLVRQPDQRDDILWCEPTLVELHQAGTFEVCSTDWAIALQQKNDVAYRDNGSEVGPNQILWGQPLLILLRPKLYLKSWNQRKTTFQKIQNSSRTQTAKNF